MLTVITELGAFLVPPCPPWCAYRASHDADNPFSYDADGRLLRYHGRGWSLAGTRPPVAIELVWAEGIGYRAGEAPREPPQLYLYADDCGSVVTPVQARQLAALLIQAADYYDREVR